MTMSVLVSGPETRYGDIFVGGLAGEVSGEQQAAADLVGVVEGQQFEPGERSLGPHGDGESEPGGLGVRRSLGQDEELLEGLEAVAKIGEVGAALGDETVEASSWARPTAAWKSVILRL